MSSRGAVVPFNQDGWVWDGANWCPPQPCPPTPPPCPPGPAGCPPWFPPPANVTPWYPGANGGVTFSATPPPNMIRGNFWYDGRVLWMFDGANWVDVGIAGISSLLGGGGSARVFISGSAPPSPAPGSLWWDGALLRLWDGTKWNVIGPSAPTGPAVGGLVGINYYGSSQLITIPVGTTRAFIQMWGGTGGSGGSTNSESAGTGSAGYLEKFLAGLTAGNSINFTLGAAGNGGAVGGAGTAGGDSVLSSGSQSIPTMTAGGSPGTPGGTSGTWPGYYVPGGVGGTASGGDLNVTGIYGGPTTQSETVNNARGGWSVFSRGADGVGAPGPGGGIGPNVPGNNGNPGGLKISWFA